MTIIRFLLATAILATSGGVTYHLVNETKANWTEARRYCSSKGGILLEMSSSEDQKLLDILKLNSLFDRVWIDGQVKFSPFVYFKGCYHLERASNSEDKTKTLKEISLFKCTKFCENNDTLWKYIGLHGKKCYCLNDISSLRSYSNFQCNRWLNSDSTAEFSDSLFSIAVYVKVASFQINNNNFPQELSSQCVYINKGGSKCRYETNSCSKHKVSGYLCEGDSQCEQSFTQHNKKTVCSVNKETTWTEARQMCNGRLVGQSECVFNNTKSYISTQLFDGNEYWTGIFRTYHVSTERYIEFGTKCLVFRKSEPNKLFPMNCSELINFICIFENTSTDESSVMSTVETSFTTHNSTGNLKKSSFSVVAVCVISASGILLIICVLVVVATVAWRNKQLLRESENQTNGDNQAVYSSVRHSAWIADQPESNIQNSRLSNSNDRCKSFQTAHETSFDLHVYNHVPIQRVICDQDGTYDLLKDSRNTVSQGKCDGLQNNAPDESVYSNTLSPETSESCENVYHHTGGATRPMNNDAAGIYDHTCTTFRTTENLAQYPIYE